MCKAFIFYLVIMFLGQSLWANSTFDNDKIRQELGSMFALERKIELLSNAIYKSENKLYLFKSDIELISQYISNEEQELSENSKTFSDSLKELIKVKNKGMAGALFSGKSMHESATSDEVSKRIYGNVLSDVEKRMLRLKKLELERERVAQKLSELEAKSKEHTKERKALVTLQTKKQKSLQSLFKDSNTTKKTVNEFNKAYSMRLSEANIQNLKNDLKSSFFLSEGKIAHPTENFITKTYGFWRHPKFGYKRIFKGHTYSMGSQDKVFAVGPGIIRYVGPIVGNETVIIVDHGGKYYSVYKGLLGPKKKVGSQINKREVLATTKKKSNLYFEIRHYSDPINLNRWMMAKR